MLRSLLALLAILSLNIRTQAQYQNLANNLLSLPGGSTLVAQANLTLGPIDCEMFRTYCSDKAIESYAAIYTTDYTPANNSLPVSASLPVGMDPDSPTTFHLEENLTDPSTLTILTLQNTDEGANYPNSCLSNLILTCLQKGTEIFYSWDIGLPTFFSNISPYYPLNLTTSTARNCTLVKPACSTSSENSNVTVVTAFFDNSEREIQTAQFPIAPGATAFLDLTNSSAQVVSITDSSVNSVSNSPCGNSVLMRCA